MRPPEERVAAKLLVDGYFWLWACWRWTGAKSKGYARANVDGKSRELHRWMYERYRGPIPDGLYIDHLCRVRDCQNPFHMEPVTNRENTLRGEGFPALRAKQTHCVNGHLFDEVNTYVAPNGTRACRRCRANVEYRRRRRLGMVKCV